MNPQIQFCHNMECAARGKAGEGNIVIHSQRDKRYQCKRCAKTFSATKGTPFYRLHKPAELMKVVITLLVHGCPPKAIEAAYGLDERTVACWQDKAGSHAKTLQEHLINSQKVQLGQVQADELRVKLCGAVVWMAMALCVGSRLWLGGVVSHQRDNALIISLLRQVKAAASSIDVVLFCVDGFKSYISGILKVFRIPQPNGRRGRPRLLTPSGLMIGQVVKTRMKHRVKEVATRVVVGNEAIVQWMLVFTQGDGQINTAYIERLNATFRSALAPLVRRSRAIMHQSKRLELAMYLVGCAYNLCWVHLSLKVTPAMAAGLTDHPWSIDELLWFKVPLPAMPVAKRQRRTSKQAQRPSLTLAA
jgi:transposase-like protein